MKRKFLMQLIVLSLAALACGCQAAAPAQLNAGRADKQYQVVNLPGEGETNPAYQPESPSIGALVQLPDGEPQVEQASVNIAQPAEVKSVWISYLEMATLLKDKSQKQFRANIGNVFDNCNSFGLNTVIIQVRPFADALYKSAYFPWSYTITGTEGQNPGFDPLAVMVEEAHARGLRIEAWVNPYRVRAAGNNNAMSSTNQAQKWLDAKNDSVVKYNGVISYNPASQEAQTLIINGVKEIVQNYDVDGIHIDDYFYPTTDTAFDKAAYTRYKNDGGKLALADWRRSNVTKLVKSMYAAVKSQNKNVLFGISPQSSMDNNYSQQFLDVAKIVAADGYCDYICPQIYFGFDNDAQPFSKTLQQWDDMVKAPSVKLYVGLAVYKAGGVDTWAGSGKNEWVNNADLLSRMVEESRNQDKYAGIVLYRYDSLFNPAAAVKAHVQKEAGSLKAIM